MLGMCICTRETLKLMKEKNINDGIIIQMGRYVSEMYARNLICELRNFVWKGGGEIRPYLFKVALIETRQDLPLKRLF